MEPNIKETRGRIDEISKRAGDAFEEIAPQVISCLPADSWSLWVDIGMAVAGASSIAAIRYFRESPEILRSIGSLSGLKPALQIVLNAARQDYGVALEIFRQYPRIFQQRSGQILRPSSGQALSAIGLDVPDIPDILEPWVRIGVELGREDYGAAIEYIKAGPEILPLLPPAEIERWARLGLQIFKEDLETKALRAYEYFRLSPQYLAKIRERSVRSRIMELSEEIAKASTTLSLALLEQAPVSLTPLESSEAQEITLLASRILARSFPLVAMPYLKNVPEAYQLSGGDLSKFGEWTSEGLALTQRDMERGKAFFSLELKTSREVLEKISGGVRLKDISRSLTFYAEALCGHPVEIRAVPATGAEPMSFNGVLFLPEQIRLFPRPEDNLRFYRVMTLHEAGHLEFGTYDPLPEESVAPLSHLPDPVLANILWTIVEEGRIDFLLRSEYPGIRADMDAVIALQMRDRPDLFQLPPHQGILEALMRLSVTEDVDVPLPLVEVVSSAFAILKNVMQSDATVLDSLKTTDALFHYLEDRLQDIRWESDSGEAPENKTAPPSSSPHHAPAPFSYRIPLRNLETLVLQEAPPPEGEPENRRTPPKRTVEDRVSHGTEEEREVTGSPPLQPKGNAPGDSHNLFLYDEWDASLGDYRRQWCRLSEKRVEGNISNVMADPFLIRSAERNAVRRYFEALRPEGFKKIKYQEYGEEVDLDAAVAAVAEKRGSGGLNPRIYFRREKKTRDVTAAFLIDMSGSTRRMVHWEKTPEAAARRVIDIEKEGLLLLSESLQAIGDEYALYGFSGQSKDQVDFFVIKGFEEAYGPLIRQRILAMEPGGQNRDGAAIRHAVRKLRSRGSRTQLLVLISDGRPLDQDYTGDYSLEDTRMALREAKALGIRPFCITIDHEADEYIRAMYQDIPYIILDDLQTLPQKLPKIYKRLTF